MKYLPMSFAFALLFPFLSFGFPETSRHGYISCSACHYSPSGRGLLTPYGKTISKELYSAFRGSEASSDELADQKPLWQIGGQFRLLQFFSQTATLEKARFFPMQSEIEGAIDTDTWAAVASIGAWKPVDATDSRFRSYFRNHYLMYRPNEQFIVRLGHFRISHGLGLPDHTILTYQSLGWTHSHETYNAELTYLNDDLVLHSSLITPSKLLVTDETIQGASVTVEKSINSKHKVGGNLSQFNRNGFNEQQINLHGIGSISDESFLQLELGLREIQHKVPSQQLAFFSRYSYEFARRWRPFVQWEMATLNQNGKDTTKRNTLGVEWFPINYFDLYLTVAQESSSHLEQKQLLNLLGHFYF